MPVTDEQEAALHAMLAKRFDVYEEKLQALDRDAARTGYSALVSAAFAAAADERFPEGTTTANVIEYVGEVRTRGEGTARLDPRIAERVILAVISSETIDDIDDTTSFQHQLVLLAALIGDADLDEAGLNAFMAKSRKLADTWLA